MTDDELERWLELRSTITMAARSQYTPLEFHYLGESVDGNTLTIQYKPAESQTQDQTVFYEIEIRRVVYHNDPFG